MNKNVQTILNGYGKRKGPDKRAQKAELLLGNEEFIDKLEKSRHPDDNEILRLLGFSNDKAKSKTERLNREKHLSEARGLLWSDFCDRWNISSKWNGRPGTLAENLRGAVRIGIIERQTIGQKEIFISLDAWATQKEVRARWHEVEELQDKILAGRVEEKANFARDLCWYRLKTKERMTISEIADLWIKHFRCEVESLVFQRMKQGETALQTDTDKELFKAEWDDYVSRETPLGNGKSVKMTSPFEYMIGKAISRMRDEFKRPTRFPTQKMPLKMTYLN